MTPSRAASGLAVVAVALALVVVLAAAVAGHAAPARGESKELIVFAASSLEEVFAALGTRFESDHPGVKVRFSFADTQELRGQVENGAHADVFAAADPKNLAALVRAKLALPSERFAQNRLVVVVPPGDPAQVLRFDQLFIAERIVIGVAASPIGAHTRQLLDRATAAFGPDFRRHLDEHIASHEPNVEQIMAKVLLNQADAALVYATDAQAVGKKVDVIAIPNRLNPVVDHPVAVLRQASDKALAQAFVAALFSEAGRKQLVQAGFRPVARAASSVAPSAGGKR